MFLDSQLAIVIYFIIGKIIVILVHRMMIEKNKLRLVLFEMSSLTYLGVSTIALSLDDSLYMHAGIGIGFVLFSIAVRRIAASDKPWLGIFDFVWIAILGFLMTIILSRQNMTIYSASAVQFYGNNDALLLFYDELQFYIDKIVISLLTLGSVLAVAMSILWGGGSWQKKHAKNSDFHYKDTTRAAICITVGFFFVLVATLNWLIVPLLVELTKIKSYVSLYIV
jgi:hypothetical protein